jgi:hypothetical protein
MSSKKNQGTENFNPRETSKEAMSKCNLFPKYCPHVHYILNQSSKKMKKGEGK